MTVNFRGYVFDDAGSAVSGASAQLLETGTTTQEGSTATTDSDGLWYFNEADQDRYDVKITSGASVRYRRWDDQISLKELDVRNNTGATTPAGTFTNLNDAVANQVAVFSGANATRADGDEIYLSFKLADSAGNLDEFARITAEATDVTNGSEDGQIRFGVAVAGTLTDVFTIDSSTGGAATISYEVDSFTIKGGEAEAGVLYLMADQGDDAGDEWKVNVADSGVMTFGNDIASAGTYVTHLTLTPNSTITSSSLTLPGILDVNGSVDWDVSDVQVDSSGDIDLVSSANAAAAIYLHQSTGTSGTIKIHADTGTSVTEGAESINILSDAGGVGIRSTANLANAVNITVDGGTTSSMTLFNDQGTGATEGSASIQLLSDVGGINIKSGLNAASAILLTADGGTSETIVLHADQGTGTGSIELLSDAGGIELDAGTDIILDAGGADIFLKDDGTLFGTLTNNSGELLIKSSSSGTTAATFSGANVTFAGTVDATTDFTIGSTVITDDSIVMTPSTNDTATIAAATNGALSITTVDTAAAAANIQITADGTAELAGTTVTLDSAADIELEATNDINVPSAVGLTFADDGQKIESDGTDFTIASGAKLNLTPTSDVHVANGTGLVVGHTAQIAIRGDTPEVQVLGTDDNDTQVGLARFSADNDGAELNFAKSRSATVGTIDTIVQDDDVIMKIRGVVDDGTDFATIAAQIQMSVDDGSPAENDVGGDISFMTAPGGGGGGVAVRMTIAADGDVTGTHGNYHVSSDVRLKENVATISNALDKVVALRGVNFTWIDTGRKGSDLQMGLIAQEVETVVPEVVHTQRTIDESGQVINIADPIKSVEYPFLVGLLVEAIKELKAEVDAL